MRRVGYGAEAGWWVGVYEYGDGDGGIRKELHT